ncbi:MAG: hypothetical protein P8Y44_09565 [Acidobacteriota bacterium]
MRTIALLLLPATLTAGSFDEPDLETERCLSEGRLVRRLATLEGVTHPELYLIECDGMQRKALVKRYHKAKRGITRFSNGTWEMNFSDSFRYERAAYLLDRQLGINMTPVAVVRKVGRSEVGIIEWIEDASQVHKSPHRPTGTERAVLAQQKIIMALFDALIFNTDRNPTNYLVDDEDWRLYLIDHSRAFRERSDLPPGYSDLLIRLPRDLYESLRELDEVSLNDLLEELLGVAQIETLLERRDKIIEKIDYDRQKMGDDVVFTDLLPN